MAKNHLTILVGILCGLVVMAAPAQEKDGKPDAECKE